MNEFRIFDKATKCYVEQTETSRHTIDQSGQLWQVFFTESHARTIAGRINNEGYILEWYTGLKDKNGKKIFEGDKTKTFNGQIGIVKFGEHDDCELKEDIEDYNGYTDNGKRLWYGYYVELDNGEQYSIDNGTHIWIEVIGTIHKEET